MSDLATLWQAIRSAGGVDAYVRQQLETKGWLVKRRPTDGMDERTLKKYKEELKREAAETRALRKAAWQAYRANHIVHLGEGVYWNDAANIDRFDHPRPEERQAELGLPALDSAQKLAEALGLSVPVLRWLAFHRDVAVRVHYRRFTIPKRSGGERAIWAPLPRLKAAQRWILREIVERLPIHGACHGFVAGRSTATNAQVHTNAQVVLRVDIQDFFPTVSLPRVRGVFRRAGYREQVATLLALLCTESPREVVEHEGRELFVALGPRCLPQGAPTSPGLTNALCLRLDRRLQGLAVKLGYRYTRYADDLTFSLPRQAGKRGPAKLSQLIGAVTAILNDEGFRPNADKTSVARTGGRQQITGLVVNGEGGPRAPRELRRRVRAGLHRLAQGRPLPEGETRETLAGLIAYIHMTQPEQGKALAAELDRVAPRGP